MITTESRNSNTMALDDMSIRDFLKVMNAEDQRIAQAVALVIPEIAKTIDWVKQSFEQDGRLIYIGAGTSGRLGILDAVECVPTFGVSEEMVLGLIAGGDQAIKRAVEGAEDSKDLAVSDLKENSISKRDIVVGIAASGKTPYVIGGLEYAQAIGCNTVAISCNKNSLIGKSADLAIEVFVGPEVLTGSTRLKAATAQKMILNMISTGSMIAIGKTYGNLMVDVQMTNNKLKERGKHIVMEATGISYQEAERLLLESGQKPKVAIIMALLECDCIQAEERLNTAGGFVKKALEI